MADQAPIPSGIVRSVRGAKVVRGDRREEIFRDDLIERVFGLVRVAWTGKLTGMSGIFASLVLQGKRIRPEKPVIKGGIFPPNSR